MKAHLYKMTCLTNLHVGKGDENYCITDNNFQKNPVLEKVIISSLEVKGALRAFATEKIKESTPLISKDQIDDIFGKDNNTPGSYKFLPAGLLAISIRVTEGKKAYILATSPNLLNAFNDLCEGIGLPKKVDISNSIISSDLKPVSVTNAENVRKVEREIVSKFENNSLDALFGDKKWVILSTLKDISLPVLAKNCLDEKEKSTNLWYEEFIPHHSVFYLIIITPGEENLLDNVINDAVVQFGEGASVAFGLMKIERL